MSGMIDRASRWAARTALLQREDLATVTALTEASASYTLSYRGASVGPVWSQNGVRYAVGQVVRVLVVGNLVKAILP